MINRKQFLEQRMQAGFERTVKGNVMEIESPLQSNLNNLLIPGNSIQNGTSTPDTPIEVVSVGEKTSNLFNPNQTPVKTNSYLGIPLEKASYTLRLELKEGKSIPSGAYFGFIYYLSESATSAQAVWLISNGKLTVNQKPFDSSSFYRPHIACFGADVSNIWNSIIDAFDIYLVKEYYTTPLTYEPYGYKIPITASGKNLYGGESEFVLSTTTNSTHQSYYDAFKVGKTYTLFGFIDNTQGTANTQFRMSVGKSVDGADTWNYCISNSIKAGEKGYSRTTFTIPETYNGKLNMQYQVNGGTVTFKDMMLVEGSYDLSSLPSYEPYHEPITTNIYLNEPLRAIGEYKDYVDFESGKIVRNIFKEFLDAVEYVSTNPRTYKVFLSNISKKPLINGSGNLGDRIGYAISNKFQKSNVNYDLMGGYQNLIQSYITTAGVNRVAYTFDDSSITTIEQAQEKIGDGFDVYYVLAEPSEETIELPELIVSNNTSVISVDTTVPCSSIEAKYRSRILRQ